MPPLPDQIQQRPGHPPPWRLVGFYGMRLTRRPIHVRYQTTNWKTGGTRLDGDLN